MVARTNWVQRGLLGIALLLPVACMNNPFNPRAELVVTDVKAPTTIALPGFTNLIGIAMQLPAAGTTGLAFLYADPVVTMKSGPKQPEAYFTDAVVKYTLEQTVLPPKRTKILFTVPSGGTTTATVPILSTDSDLLKAVFPNNTPTLGVQGLVEVTMLGKDKNGNELSVDFTSPLTFTSLTSSGGVVTAPVVSPSAAATAAPAASASPSPRPSASS